MSKQSNKTTAAVAETNEMSGTETVQETVVAAPKAVKKTTVQTVVYVGPTIPGVASHNTVFNNGLTNEMSAAIEREPAFGNLIVPIDKLAQAGKEIATQSGATYVFYKRAENYKA